MAYPQTELPLELTGTFPEDPDPFRRQLLSRSIDRLSEIESRGSTNPNDLAVAPFALNDAEGRPNENFGRFLRSPSALRAGMTRPLDEGFFGELGRSARSTWHSMMGSFGRTFGADTYVQSKERYFLAHPELQSPEFESTAGKMGRYLGNGLVSSAPSLAVGAIASVILGPEAGATLAGRMVMSGLMTATTEAQYMGDNYAMLREAAPEKSPYTALGAALFMSVLQGGIETVTFGTEAKFGRLAGLAFANRVLKEKVSEDTLMAIGKMSIFARGSYNLLKQSMGEGVEEVLQQGVSDLGVAALGGKPTTTLAQYWDQFAGGVVGGFGLSMGHVSISHLIKTDGQKRMERAINNAVVAATLNGAEVRDGVLKQVFGVQIGNKVEIDPEAKAEADKAFADFEAKLPADKRSVVPIIKNLSYQFAVEFGKKPQDYISTFGMVFLEQMQLTPSEINFLYDRRTTSAQVYDFLMTKPAFRQQASAIRNQKSIEEMRRVNDDIAGDNAARIGALGLQQVNPSAVAAKIGEVKAVGRQAAGADALFAEDPSTLRSLYANGRANDVEIKGPDGKPAKYDVIMADDFSLTIVPASERAASAEAAVKAQAAGKVEDAELVLAREQLRQMQIGDQARRLEVLERGLFIPVESREAKVKQGVEKREFQERVLLGDTDESTQKLILPTRRGPTSLYLSPRQQADMAAGVAHRAPAAIANRLEGQAVPDTLREALTAPGLSVQSRSAAILDAISSGDPRTRDAVRRIVAGDLELAEIFNQLVEKGKIDEDPIRITPEQLEAEAQAADEAADDFAPPDTEELARREQYRGDREAQRQRMLDRKALADGARRIFEAWDRRYNWSVRQKISARERMLQEGTALPASYRNEIMRQIEELRTQLPVSEQRTPVAPAEQVKDNQFKDLQQAMTVLQNRQQIFSDHADQSARQESNAHIQQTFFDAAGQGWLGIDKVAMQAPSESEAPWGMYLRGHNLAVFLAHSDPLTVIHEWVHHIIYNNLIPPSSMAAILKKYGSPDSPVLTMDQEENAANALLVYIRDNALPKDADPDLIDAFTHLKGIAKTTYKLLRDDLSAAEYTSTVFQSPVLPPAYLGVVTRQGVVKMVSIEEADRIQQASKNNLYANSPAAHRIVFPEEEAAGALGFRVFNNTVYYWDSEPSADDKFAIENELARRGITGEIRHNSLSWDREGAARLFSGRIMASPNTDSITFDIAYERISAPRQAQFSQTVDGMLKDMRMQGRVISAVGDWNDPAGKPGAENSVMVTIDGDYTPAQLEYLAASIGHSAGQMNVLAYEVKPDGPHNVYEMNVPRGTLDDKTLMTQLRDDLTKAGIYYRTIVPSPEGLKVYIFQEDRGAEAAITALAEARDIVVSRYAVVGTFIGGFDGIERSRSEYERRIQRFEAENSGRIRGAGKSWNLNSWSAAESAGGQQGSQAPGGQSENVSGAGEGVRLQRPVGEWQHYSTVPGLRVLDPLKHGHGAIGAEIERMANYRFHYLPRIYLGDRQYKKESQLGNERYAVRIENDLLYNWVDDPNDLVDRAQRWARGVFDQTGNPAYLQQGAVTTFMELAIKSSGFLGAYSPDDHMALVFYPVPTKEVVDERYMRTVRGNYGSYRLRDQAAADLREMKPGLWAKAGMLSMIEKNKSDYSAFIAGHLWQELERGIPVSKNSARMDPRPTTDTKQAEIRYGTIFMRDFPPSVTAGDGSTVLIHNPEGGYRGAEGLRLRNRHLITYEGENAGERRLINAEKAKWMPVVVETLQNADVRLLDDRKGRLNNRIYVRRYQDTPSGDRQFHIVVVEPEAGEKGGLNEPVKSRLITQFPSNNTKDLGELEVEWVKPSLNRVLFQRPVKVESFLTDAEREAMTDRGLATAQRIFNETPDLGEIVSAALLGKDKAEWYSKIRDLGKIFGDDTPKFMGLLASLSPQTGVKENMNAAIRVWSNYLDLSEDQKGDVKAVKRALNRAGIYLKAKVNNATAVLAFDQDEWRMAIGEKNVSPLFLSKESQLSGFKVSSFFKNLIGDGNAVTADTWIGRFVWGAAFDADKSHKQIGASRPVYNGVQAAIRQAAKELGWEPAQVQAAIWSTFIALSDLRDANNKVLDSNAALPMLTQQDIIAIPDFLTEVLTNEANQQFLRRAGYGREVDWLLAKHAEETRGSTGIDPREPIIDRIGRGYHKSLRAVAERAAGAQLAYIPFQRPPPRVGPVSDVMDAGAEETPSELDAAYGQALALALKNGDLGENVPDADEAEGVIDGEVRRVAQLAPAFQSPKDKSVHIQFGEMRKAIMRHLFGTEKVTELSDEQKRFLIAVMGKMADHAVDLIKGSGLQEIEKETRMEREAKDAIERNAATAQAVADDLNARPHDTASKEAANGTGAVATIKNIAQAIGNRLGRLGHAFVSASFDLRGLTRYMDDNNPNGVVTRAIADPMMAANRKASALQNEIEKQILDKVKALGRPWDGIYDEVKLDGKRFTMSDAVKLYMWANGETKDSYADNLPISAWVASNKIQGASEQAVRDAIALVKATPQAMNEIELQRTLFDTLFERIVKTYTRITGKTDLKRISGMYAPMVRLDGMYHDAEWTRIFETLDPQATMQQIRGYQQSFLKHRKGGGGGRLSTDARGDFMRYVRTAINYIAKAETVKDTLAVLRNPVVLDAFQQHLGGEMAIWKTMEKLVSSELLITGRVDPKVAGEDLLSAARGQVYGSLLSMNPFTVITQLTSFWNGMADLPVTLLPAAVRNMMSSFGYGLSSPGRFSGAGRTHLLDGHESWDLMRRLAPDITRRMGDPEIEHAMSTTPSGYGVQGSIRRLAEMGTAMMANTDICVVTAIWRTAFDHRLQIETEKGVPAEQAERTAADWASTVVTRTQNPSTNIEKNVWQKGTEWAKMWIPFSGQQFVNMRYYYTDMVAPVFAALAGGEGITGKVAAVAKTLARKEMMRKLTFAVALPALTIGTIARRRPPKDMSEAVQDMLIYPFMSIPVVGQILWASVAMGWESGNSGLYGSFLESLSKAAKDVSSGQADFQTWKSASQSVAILARIPAYPVRVMNNILKQAIDGNLATFDEDPKVIVGRIAEAVGVMPRD